MPKGKSPILFEGYTLSGVGMAEHLADAAGRDIGVQPMFWLSIQLARPLWPMAKHLLEMRYLWGTPHMLVSDRLRSLCPGYRDTPVHEVLIKVASQWLTPTQPKYRLPHSICRSTQTSL